MRIGKLKIALLLVCCGVISFEIWHLRHASGSAQQITPDSARKHEPLFALLPESEISIFAGQFANPKPHLEGWEPTVGDVYHLEADLPQIAALSSNNRPDTNLRIEHPDSYFRQYLAVIIDGRKTIYVNSMCTVSPDERWRKHLVLVTDGGKCYWHATYDPANQKFSALEVNGVG